MEGATLEEFSYEHQTVLPGLVDCHVHLIGTGGGRSGGDLATLPDEVLPEYAGSTRSGRWKGGKKADVLVVDGAPSEDIKPLWNVVDVF